MPDTDNMAQMKFRKVMRDGFATKADDFLHGVSRALREQFTVYVARRDSDVVVPVRAPFWCYYADPFLVECEGAAWLFVERMDYRCNRGDLCAMALDEKFRPGRAVAILPRPRHASFPFVFHGGSELYLIPETNADNAVDLYRCAAFPHRWVHHARLLDGVHASDSVVLQHEGLWWLITARVERSESPQPFLAVYYSQDLRGAPWHPHPVNETRLYQDLSYSSLRNAGPPVFHDGSWLRPVQRNTHYYGQSVEFMRIECLTPSEYREVPFQGPPPFANIAAQLHRAHHVAATQSLVTFDRRTRARDGLRNLIQGR
jgi:hypothetical protein